MNIDQRDRVTSRHIAKLLTRLGDTIAPVTVSEIKRQMRFLSEDLISENKETSANEYKYTSGNH